MRLQLNMASLFCTAIHEPCIHDVPHVVDLKFWSIFIIKEGGMEPPLLIWLVPYGLLVEIIDMHSVIRNWLQFNSLEKD